MTGNASRLRLLVPVDNKLSFPVIDGSELVLHRGAIECEVHYQKVPREGTRHSWDSVACQLFIVDRDGHELSLERLIGANAFLELVRTSRYDPTGELRPLVEGLRCYHDHRIWIPTVGRVSGELVAIAYWAKQLDAVIDLLSWRLGEWDHLAIRIHTVPYGAIGLRPSPTICVATDWAAKVVLWPSLLSMARGPIGEEPVFKPTGAVGTPQPLVETAGKR
jgi:hypothetical protein